MYPNMYGFQTMGPLMRTRADLYEQTLNTYGISGGAAAGAAIGALGLIGGPLAFLTIPAGAALGAFAGKAGTSLYANFRDFTDNGIRDGSPLVAQYGPQQYGPVVNPFAMYGMGGMGGYFI